MFKKSLILFIILMTLIPNFNYADDKSSEIISPIELKQTIEASNNVSNLSEAPKINSRHAVVIERNTHTILYGKKENEKCKMASTTKIMTATVVIENANLNDTVTVSAKAAP